MLNERYKGEEKNWQRWRRKQKSRKENLHKERQKTRLHFSFHNVFLCNWWNVNLKQCFSHLHITFHQCPSSWQAEVKSSLSLLLILFPLLHCLHLVHTSEGSTLLASPVHFSLPCQQCSAATFSSIKQSQQDANKTCSWAKTKSKKSPSASQIKRIVLVAGLDMLKTSEDKLRLLRSKHRTYNLGQEFNWILTLSECVTKWNQGGLLMFSI